MNLSQTDREHLRKHAEDSLPGTYLAVRMLDVLDALDAAEQRAEQLEKELRELRARHGE